MAPNKVTKGEALVGMIQVLTNGLIIAGTTVTTTAAELNRLAGVVAGAVSASKALVVDANKRLDELVLGTLKLGAGAGTALTATANELNALDGAATGAPTFTPAAEVGNMIDVAVQLKDADAVNLAVRTGLYGYLSDNADGSTLTGTAADGGIAAGAAGIVDQQTAGKSFYAVTNAAGLVNIRITHSLAKTYYGVLVLPNGKLAVSGAITFA